MAAKQLGRPRILLERMSNVYFDLTEEFNADGVIAVGLAERLLPMTPESRELP